MEAPGIDPPRPEAPRARGRPARVALAALAALYVAGVFVASATPGPRAWGLHLLGFLGGVERLLVAALLIAGVAFLALAAGRSDADERAAETPAAVARAPRSPRSGPAAGAWLLLPAAYGALLWLLRPRAYFLGDDPVRLAEIRAGGPGPLPEPLAWAAWNGVARLLGAAGAPRDPGLYGLLPAACGALAALLAARIARDLVPAGAGRTTAIAILLTLGSAALFAGSLGPGALAVLLLLAALSEGIRLGLRRGAWWRAALAAVGALASFPFAALGLGAPAPDAILSLPHAADLGNELLLVLPAALALGLAALLGGRARLGGAAGAFLAVAAVLGLALAAAARPAAPALAWGALAICLLPLAPLALAAAAPWLASERDASAHAGLRLLGAGTLLAFLLVNARTDASLLRFKTLIASGARIAPGARAYPNEVLASYYEERRDWLAALHHARLALAYQPSNPRYWVKVGAEYNRLGQHDKAIRALTGALRRGPDRADARYQLGLAYVLSGRPEEGIEALRRAIALPGGDRPAFHHELGSAYAAAGDTAAARDEWSALLRRWPGYLPAWRAMTRSRAAERAAAGLVH